MSPTQQSAKSGSFPFQQPFESAPDHVDMSVLTKFQPMQKLDKWRLSEDQINI